MDWLLDDEPIVETFHRTPWKIAIIDDDLDVHKVTQLILKEFQFEQRQLKLIHAYSAAQAKELFAQHDDIAIALLDVVMEDEHAGLGVVKYIREQLDNHYTRIILRTGQPGSVPEDKVIQDYDIDGYKSKTELTRSCLNHTLYTNLRAYRDITNIQRYQKGLTAIIDAMSKLAEVDDIDGFAAALMQQLAGVLNSSRTEFIMQDSEAFTVAKDETKRWHIMVNELETQLSQDHEITDSNQDFVTIAERALTAKSSLLEPPLYAHYYCSKKGLESVFILRNSQLLSDFNQQLLQLFSQNAVLMLEHIFNRQQSK